MATSSMKSNHIDDITNYYHIHEKKLGEGGFAKVRLATHLATRQYVAIKCLDKVKLGSELPRIYNEIECLKKLKHQHIARLFQVFETPTNIYLVLEYCAGGELFDYIVSKSKLDEPEASHIFHDLIQVLDYIHINGFAHRDLKPENVLFDDKHQIKLIDFGLAANCSAANMANNKNQQPLDQLSTCCGSVTYAAPEVISGGLYSGPAVDVWSAGVMLYALLVGQLPFNDSSIPKLYQKIQAGIKSLPQFLSPNARDLIMKMLTVDPSKRITIRQVLVHPWLVKSKLSLQSGRNFIVNRRLEFQAPAQRPQKYIDEQLIGRCCVKFPKVDATRMKQLILEDFNYYSTTYHLMQATKRPLIPRSMPVKRTPDKMVSSNNNNNNHTIDCQQQQQQHMNPIRPPTIPPVPPIAHPSHQAATQVYSSPTKKTRFVTVTNSPRVPKTPPSYLRRFQENEVGQSNTTSPKRPSTRSSVHNLAATVLSPRTPGKQQQNENSSVYRGMSAFMYGPTPKKSIVKRILESATPSKMRQPRKILLRQNEIMNVTLTRYKDPNLCLGHFEEALKRKGFLCKRKDFSLKCHNQSIRFTLEVCNYGNQCAIQRKRIKGDAWQYKLICEEILRISNSIAAQVAPAAKPNQGDNHNSHNESLMV